MAPQLGAQGPQVGGVQRLGSLAPRQAEVTLAGLGAQVAQLREAAGGGPDVHCAALAGVSADEGLKVYLILVGAVSARGQATEDQRDRVLAGVILGCCDLLLQFGELAVQPVGGRLAGEVAVVMLG